MLGKFQRTCAVDVRETSLLFEKGQEVFYMMVVR